MKKIKISLITALLCATTMNGFSQMDSISYAIGVNIGKSLSMQGIEVDADWIYQGMKDVLAGEAKLTDQQAQAIMMKMQQELMKKQQGSAAEENLAKGQAFLAENAKKEGVKQHESGLQYKVLRAGNGASPTLTDQIKIHYRGTTIDGKEFDSSYKRGEPATFPLNNLIKGWQIALPLMKEGAKWELYIPSDMAYGLNAPPSIGPNQTLIFEIELFEVVK